MVNMALGKHHKKITQETLAMEVLLENHGKVGIFLERKICYITSTEIKFGTSHDWKNIINST